MPVTRLTLADFRSYASASLDPGPGFVLLFGENGAGKTNLLEAVSMLAPGRGLRGAALSDMARLGGSNAWAVAARLGATEIGTGTVAAAPERRQVRINAAPASVNSLSEWLSVLWLTLDGLHVFTSVNDLVKQIVGSESSINVLDYVQFSKVLSISTLVAVIDVFLLTALATIGAFLYNVVAALVGGVHVTMTDE